MRAVSSGLFVTSVALVAMGLFVAACGDSAPAPTPSGNTATPNAELDAVTASEGSTTPTDAEPVAPPKPAEAQPPIAEEPAEKPVAEKPAASSKWKPYFEALPFELGPKRALAKAKALKKPVFFFYAATW